MKKNFKIYKSLLFFLLMMMMCFCLPAQDSLRADSAVVNVRNFSTSSIKEYRTKRDFIYTATAEMPSLWDRFWMWFWQKVYSIFDNESAGQTFEIIIITLSIAALIFFFYRLNKMNKVSLFNSKSNGGHAYNVEEENIHVIQFDEQIKTALAANNYRLAIRLRYLQSLKLLSDSELIEWQPNKTNHDYYYELKKQGLQRSFKQLTQLFEHAWYGNKITEQNVFTSMDDCFADLKHNIS